MPYSDKDYFLSQLKESELNNLLLDDAKVPQDAYLTAKINAADNLIDGYLRKVAKTLPLDPVPAIIQQCSFSIALLYLHVRIQANQIPEYVKDLYDTAIDFLKSVSEGRATLEGIEADNEDTQVSYETGTNVMTRDSF